MSAPQEGPTRKEYSDAIKKYIDQNPKVDIDEDGKATMADTTGTTTQHLLWDRDNQRFLDLIGANEEGTETFADPSGGQWIGAARATDMFLLQPGLLISSNNKRKSYIPRVPKQLVAAAITSKPYHGFTSRQADNATDALAMGMLFFYAEFLGKASLYQLTIEQSQISARRATYRGEQQRLYGEEAYAVQLGLEQIIDWRTTHTLASKSKREMTFELDGATYSDKLLPFRHPKTRKRLTKDQLEIQVYAARRHMEHVHTSYQAKATKAKVLDHEETINALQSSMQTLKRELGIVRKEQAAQARLRESSDPTSDDRNVAQQLAQHFKKTNNRNELADRKRQSHAVFSDISQQAKKLFEEKGLLGAKGYLRLGEGGEAEKALRLFHQAFVERKLADIPDVRTIDKLKSDVYIKVISTFLPSHVGKWASGPSAPTWWQGRRASSPHQRQDLWRP